MTTEATVQAGSSKEWVFERVEDVGLGEIFKLIVMRPGGERYATYLPAERDQGFRHSDLHYLLHPEHLAQDADIPIDREIREGAL